MAIQPENSRPARNNRSRSNNSASDQAPPRTNQSANPGVKPGDRPFVITVICTLGFLGLLSSMQLAFSDLAAHIGTWYQAYLLAGAAVELICMIGLWRMRRWSVFLYSGYFVIDQTVLALQGLWLPILFVLPLFVIAAGFLYLRRMR